VYLINCIMFMTPGCELDQGYCSIREGELDTNCLPAAGPHGGKHWDYTLTPDIKSGKSGTWTAEEVSLRMLFYLLLYIF
jgi:hypothetical protein